MLAVPDAPIAAEWYKKALGGRDLWTLGSVMGWEIESAPSVLHEPTNSGFDSLITLGTTTGSVEVFIDDPDAFVSRAVAAGAEGSRDEMPDHPPPWGIHREGGFHDRFGHNWLVADKSPLERFPR